MRADDGAGRSDVVAGSIAQSGVAVAGGVQSERTKTHGRVAAAVADRERIETVGCLAMPSPWHTRTG